MAPADNPSTRNYRFTVGQWTLDPAASRLERRGEKIHLEPRLTDLLCHFARNPLRVIPKEELINEVWQGRALDNAAVARAIAELRRALGDTPQEPRYIETIPKRGYRLVARVGGVRRRWGRAVAVGVATVTVTVVVLVLAFRPVSHDEPASIDLPGTTHGSSDEQALQAYRMAAEALEGGGQTGNESAVVHLTRALAHDPDFALAHAGLAEAYSVRATWYGADGDWADAALAEASRAVALAPDLPDSHRALGFALSTNGRFGDARISYRRALELRPGDEEITFRLGELLTYSGEWPDALATFVSLIPHEAGAGWLKCAIGTLLLSLDYDAEARVLLEAALAAEPFDVCSNIRLALSDIAAGELESARSRMERLSAAHAACEACDQLLGEVSFRQGRPTEAASHFARALERAVEPKSTLIRVRLARLEGDSDALRTLGASLERQLTAGVDTWFPAWLLAIVSAELGDEAAALEWHREARARGHLDWRSDLAEPAFESLRETRAFQSAISAMRMRIAEMRREIEDRGLLDTIRPWTMRRAEK